MKLYLVEQRRLALDDMTFRALQKLKEVDWIALLRTRDKQGLLKSFDTFPTQISFQMSKAKEKIPDLIGFT